MESANFIALSIATSHGIPLALALRELVLLRRARGGGSWPRLAPAVPAPSPKPVGTSPLPDCLIPRPLPGPLAEAPGRTRMLEHT